MTVVLALLAVLVPASVTLVGYWFKQQAGKRLTQEQEQSRKRLVQEQQQENDRLRLDAAMRAAKLFSPSGDAAGDAASSASGLLALTRLGFADLAVALLVDLWSPKKHRLLTGRAEVETEAEAGTEVEESGLVHVSTETAIQVINAALETCEPDAQLMAAELLCRNAAKLDICDSLHWPTSVNSAWIPELPVTAKLLLVDALVHMALASKETKNALRELAVRLYGISNGDPEPRVKGCIGFLMKAIMPAVQSLGYTDFMKGPGHGLVNLKEMEDVAAKASHHPDGYFEMIVKDRSIKLEKWSQKCTGISRSAGMLAPASFALRGAHREYN
jgi:hypothetical protein